MNKANKTYNCDECEFFNRMPIGKPCNKGHKPRFYYPKNTEDWGFKRKCEDFEPMVK